MAKRKSPQKISNAMYGIIGIVAICIAAGQFLLKHIWIVAAIILIPLSIFLIIRLAKFIRNRQKPNQKVKSKTKRGGQLNLTDYHFENAKAAEKAGNYLEARREYRKAARIAEKGDTPERYGFFKTEFEQFVQRDPVFSSLITVFNKGIEDNPGIQLSRLTFGENEAAEWAKQYNYDGIITVEDIGYVLEFGKILGCLDIDDEHESRLSMSAYHIEKARESERGEDYLGARISYLQNVETLKRAGEPEALEKAEKEYADFVRRDPVFNKLLPVFLAGIKENPGILQSDITKKVEAMDWTELRSYGRPIAKDDIRYVLYFAEQFGCLIRQKSGRSYKLYLPEQLKIAESE